MRAAPAVTVLARRAGAWRALHIGAPALAAAAVAAWLLTPRWLEPRHAAMAALLAAVIAAVLAWRPSRLAPVVLSWNGQQWAADAQVGQLHVMIDLGAWLLLRLRPAQGAALWIPVTAADAGPALHALRAAVHARQPLAEPAPTGAAPAPPPPGRA